MKFPQFLTLFFYLFVTAAFSQNFELGKVTIDELKESKHPKDSSAAAAILFEKGRTYYDVNFDLVTEITIKIKIYKKEGYDWANKEIYYNINRGQSVDISKAVTYNLINGQIEKTELKQEGQFTEKVNKSWRVRKIKMPNVKELAIVEYKYKLTSNRAAMPDWRFQYDIPVNYSEYTVAIPEYYNYRVHKKGKLPIKEKMTTTDGRSGMGNYSRQFIIKNTQYTVENIPALKDEAYVDNIQNYLLGIEFELTSTNLPNRLPQFYNSNWESVSRSILEDEDFGPELDKKSYFTDDLKGLLVGVNERDEKIKIIFNYVKTRMKWNKYVGYSCDDGVTTAYKNKTGNVAEINLMLVAMLRYAGIDASPVIVSTRSNGIALYPSMNAFNYVIAAVEIPNDIILLDATSKNTTPNVLPIRDLNWMGRIIRSNGSSASILLDVKFLSKDYTNLMATINTDGSVEGKIKVQNFDYNGFMFRENSEDTTEETYLEKLEEELGNVEISEYVSENKTELDKPVIETFSFKNNNAVEIIGNKMYFSPLLFFSLKENPFKQEERVYPVDFVYPNQKKFLFIINIPEGYTVESIPEPVSFVFTENLLGYKFNISSNGKQIQITSVFDINTNMLLAEEYEEIKKFYAEMIKKQTEKIVLKKA